MAVAHSNLAFRCDSGIGHVLQLAAVSWLGDHAHAFDDCRLVRRGADRQAYQHRGGGDCSRGRRMAATVLDVAVLAGIGVEQRAKAVTGNGRGRGDDPGIAEETIAHAEVETAQRREIGRGQRERIVVGFEHGSAAARKGFAGFSLGELWCLVTATQSQRKADG